MYKICKTVRSESRQKEFEATLLSMLKTQKMQDVNIVSLCKEMQISRKTFYQYFDTIEDVLYSVVDKALRDGFLLLEVEPEMEKFFEYWKKNKWLLDVLEKNEMSQLLVDRSYDSMLKSMAGEKFSTQFMKNAAWISGIFTVLVLWHHSGMEQTPAEMKELIYAIFHVQLKK